MNTPFARAALAVFRKDLRAELRSRELFSAMILFSLIAILVFSFALELTSPLLSINEELRRINELLAEAGSDALQPVDPLNMSSIVGGMFWVVIIFSAILGLNRSLASERDQGNLDAMLIAPVPRAAIFIGKTFANFLFTLLVGAILLPVITFLFDINLVRPELIAVMVLGIFGITTIGTLLAAMAAQTRSRETLLPIIMLPAVLPVLLSVVRASNGIIDGQPADLWSGWLAFIAAIDLVYLGMSYAAFGFVVED
ncbi:MAG TPA: heme exporter protein CcmB [Aggregatilineales bacterium]|jgi:heme exporter protein B|nr:heme exporter protein CcmB [Aggregatilineales bacterium]